MSKNYLFILAFMLNMSGLYAQDLTNYYKSADDLKKAELKTALYKIISKHQTLSYSSLWDHYETSDACLDDPKQVFDMFSTKKFYFSTVGNSMNKEHVVPQSWWGKGAKYGIYSDLFNVYPSEAKANSAKSNYPLGKVSGKIILDNGRIKVGSSSNSGGASNVVEPYDEFKGDFARVYLYDATCYQNIPWESTASAFPKGGNTYPTLDKWIIPILLEWNRLDPPSEWEITRNNRVYSIQGNRNPFIDYPQLAEYIWGDSIDYAWDLDTAVPNSIGGGNINPVDPIDPIIPDTPQDTIVPPSYAGLVYNYEFSDIQKGNSTTSSGSSDPWDEVCDSLTKRESCYQAGGAVRLGTSKKSGSITTLPINIKAGKTMAVTILVKGWSTVEGTLKVNVDGEKEKDITYSAKMKDDFEVCNITYNKISKTNPTITISTSDKRCFISSISVYEIEIEGANEITDIEKEDIPSISYNLSGQRINNGYKGIVIRNGKKYLMR